MKRKETLEELQFFISILNPEMTPEQRAEAILKHLEDLGMVPEHIEAWGNHWEDG